MDGTLTPSRREMTKDFEEFYSNWAKNHTFFLVSGSNLEKIKEQVPEYILNLSEGVFTCGGNQLWLNGELSYNHEFKPENDLIHFLCRMFVDFPIYINSFRPFQSFHLSCLQLLQWLYYDQLYRFHHDV